MENKRVAYLTPEEWKAFTNILSSYQGALVDAAEASGLHIQTLILVRRSGYASTKTIAIVRDKILSKVMA